MLGSNINEWKYEQGYKYNIQERQDINMLNSPMSTICRIMSLFCCLSGITRGDDAHTMKLRLFDDKSQWAEWIPPTQSSAFLDDKPIAPLLGMLFVGRAEFNWVVDIRTDNADQEGWAVGNLINEDTVLTTCRAMWLLEGASKFPRENLIKMTHFHRGSDIRINFCTSFLWEEYRPFTDDGTKFEYEYTSASSFSGGRVARKLISHPECNLNTLHSDVGLIELSKPIKTKFSEFKAPYVGLMPFDLDAAGLVKRQDESKLKRSVCHVVSYGKNFMNIQNHQANDYKTKTRVILREFQECWNVWAKICPAYHAACVTHLYPNHRLDEAWCFRGDLKIGAVCDHDRGAPLVCDGRAVGFVTRGNALENCNNNSSAHFLVLKLDKAGDFLHSFNNNRKRSFAINVTVCGRLLVLSTTLLGMFALLQSLLSC